MILYREKVKDRIMGRLEVGLERGQEGGFVERLKRGIQGGTGI